MRAATRTLLVTLTAVALACGGGGDSTGPGGHSPAAIDRFAGDSQVAAAGTVLPESLAVRVTDAGGQPVAGTTVNWSVIGAGSVSPASSLTDAQGVARTSRTLGASAGHAKTTAAVNGLTALQFEAVAQIQGAVTIASNVTSALTDTVLGTLADPEPRPSVKVTDQNGDPVAGVNVTWSATGGGVIGAGTVPTDGNGISTVGYTFGASTAGAYQAHATVTGLIGSPVNLSLTATAGAPTQLAKSSGDGLLLGPGTSTPLVVIVKDAHGNGVNGVTIDWSATSGGGSVTPGQNATGADGKATASRTLGATTGIDTTSATAAGIAGGPTVKFTTQVAPIILVGNNFFNPTTLTVSAGDSVLFNWNGITVAHNVTFGATVGHPANIPDATSGAVWRVFATPGVFAYQCTNHPGMTGSVTVN